MGATIFQKLNLFWIILGTILGFTLMALFFNLVSPSIFARTEVPLLTKKTLDKSRKIVSESELKLFVTKRVKSNAPKNTVISQTPSPGKRVRKNSFIKIILSNGKDSASADSQVKQVEVASLAKVSRKNKTSKNSSNKELEGKIVCIDPGHQSKPNLDLEPIGPGSSQMKEKVRGGSTGVDSKTPEYEITLEISLKLKSLLEESGIKVIMTRESNNVNISNAQRAEIANKAQADLFVRIHADGSNDSKTVGVSTLYPAKNQWNKNIYEESYQAAQIIQRELVKATNREDRGVTPRSDITGFNWSQVPVVLPEVGFLSNPEEDILLNSNDFQQKIARGLHRGIRKFLAEK